MLFPQIRRQLTNKTKEEHQQVIKEKDNQIQALQHEILKNKEIVDLIKNRHVPRRGYFDNVLCFIKKNSEEVHPYMLFDANIDSLKNIRDVLNFVTQTWRRLAGVMIQMLFIDGTYSRAK